LLQVSVSSDGDVLPVLIKDHADGTYSALFQLQRAGPYKISLQSGNDQRTELGECVAGVTSLPHCALAPPPSQWVRGSPCCVSLSLSLSLSLPHCALAPPPSQWVRGSPCCAGKRACLV
jgi:hypothetical protein